MITAFTLKKTKHKFVPPRRTIQICLYALLMFIEIPALGQAQQAVDFGQVTRPVVQIGDAGQIAFLLDALIILTEEETTLLEIIDITSNGFGPDDVVVVHPTMETHKLPPVLPADVQNIMSGWQLEANTQFDGANEPAASFNPEIDATLQTQQEKAERAIMYDLLRSLERNYRDQPVSLLLERNPDAFTFQMWDYNERALSYSPPPPAQPDTVSAFDMFYVIRSDSVIIADTTLFDVFFVSKKVEETVWMPDVPDDISLKVPHEGIRVRNAGQ